MADARHAAKAVLDRNPAFIIGTLYKLGIYRACGKAGWTENDAGIAGFGIDIGLVEAVCGIAFFSSDKNCAHLHTVCAQFQHALDICGAVQTAGGEDRVFYTVFHLEIAHKGKHFGERIFQLLFGACEQVIQLKPQMTARLGTFDDDTIRDAVVLFEPVCQHQAAGARR